MQLPAPYIAVMHRQAANSCCTYIHRCQTLPSIDDITTDASLVDIQMRDVTPSAHVQAEKRRAHRLHTLHTIRRI